MPEHSGQVAFPGGRADPEDTDPEQTALREAYEEIGLRPSDVHLLGRLQDYLTITNYQVTPVVGVIPWPYDLHPAEEEVSRVFAIPLDWLAQAEHFVAAALQAALAPADQLPGRSTAAWKAAMQARMARNCAMIETGQASADSESQRQYKIAQGAVG